MNSLFPESIIIKKIAGYCSLGMIILLSLISILTSSCTDECKKTVQYVLYEPIYQPMADIRASIAVEAPQPIQASGKIYIYQNWLLINEPGAGIHIFNNQDKTNPTPVSFINIPGNNDMAVRNNVLFADSYLDLVLFDISNPANAQKIESVENVFPPHFTFGFSSTAEMALTGFEETEMVEVLEGDCGPAQMQPWGGFRWGNGVAFDMASAEAMVAPSNTTGIGGSMARFTITGDYLYMINESSIKPVNIQNPSEPNPGDWKSIGWGIETIFPYEDKLFIGAVNGMYIMSIADPTDPSFLSLYSHVNACDPVVVEGKFAYVTLRSGNICDGFSDQLEVVDISNPSNPQRVKIYPMFNPHGLGIDNGTLFICDGDEGLKIYDARDVNLITDYQIAHYSDLHAFDIIPFQNVAIMIGKDGLRQYDYSDLSNITLLSSIQITPSNP